MTVTNNERRAVAKRLREHIGKPLFTGQDLEDIMGAQRSDFDAVLADASYRRLADLIDPDPDITCELEPTASERTNAPVRVYECDCCGKSCDAVWAEDYVYCPYCGRLNTAREVEVEE